MPDSTIIKFTAQGRSGSRLGRDSVADIFARHEGFRFSAGWGWSGAGMLLELMMRCVRNCCVISVQRF